jgi:hypothetical protein
MQKGNNVEQEDELKPVTAEDHAAGINLNWCIGCSPDNCTGCDGIYKDVSSPQPSVNEVKPNEQEKV